MQHGCGLSTKQRSLAKREAKWDNSHMSTSGKEVRIRNIPPGEHQRILVAAAQCGVRPSDFCRTAVNEFCRLHEREQKRKRSK